MTCEINRFVECWYIKKVYERTKSFVYLASFHEGLFFSPAFKIIVLF